MIRLLTVLVMASLLAMASVKHVDGAVKVDWPVLFYGDVLSASGNYTAIYDSIYVLQKGEFNVTGYVIAPLAAAWR